jgi:crotonobetainyl-CoA:carnitine CoA-transferase CaiB-like acyl-CoA transferase
VRSALAAHSALESEQVFGEHVPCAAVRPIEDIFDHPQVLAEDLVATLDHPQVGRYRAMQGPIKFTDTPGPVPKPAPTFGQHSDEILAGCGYSAEEIAALRQRGVVRTRSPNRVGLRASHATDS